MNSDGWEVTTSSGRISAQDYNSHLLSGFKGKWGYSCNNIILRNIKQKPPYSFTVSAFKEIDESLYICVRANKKDECGDNLKMLHWNKWDNASELVCRIIYMFLNEIGYVLRTDYDCAGTCCIN